MDLNNKLETIPHIYYFNLDNRTDRKDWMEFQFERWNIKNYTRVSSSKYLASKTHEWIHLIEGEIYRWGEHPAATVNAISHISFLMWWLENSNDSHLILMEDDYDLSLIEYWHFDWDYLMNNIPYDWDCIQLGYESQEEIKFFLSPKPFAKTFFGPCMLNRRYVEKIVDLHYKDGKFLLNKKMNNYQFLMDNGSANVDYFIAENGKTYCLPLITTNIEFGSYEDDVHKVPDCHVKSRELYYWWWKNERDKFTLEDFFTYNKPYDKLMTKKIYE
jgi:hypothetical protein